MVFFLNRKNETNKELVGTSNKFLVENPEN